MKIPYFLITLVILGFVGLLSAITGIVLRSAIEKGMCTNPKLSQYASGLVITGTFCAATAVTSAAVMWQCNCNPEGNAWVMFSLTFVLGLVVLVLSSLALASVKRGECEEAESNKAVEVFLGLSIGFGSLLLFPLLIAAVMSVSKRAAPTVADALKELSAIDEASRRRKIASALDKKASDSLSGSESADALGKSLDDLGDLKLGSKFSYKSYSRM